MLENLVQTNLHFQPENSSPVKEKNFGLEENLNLVFTKNDSLTCNINKSSFPTNNFNLVDQKQPTSLFNSADFCLTSNPTIFTD